MSTISVKVTKTIQVQQYEPVTVEVVETMELDDDADNDVARKNLYKRVTRSVAEYIENEKAKWEREAKTRKSK